MGDEDLRTVWCGNLSDKVTEELLYELFLQVAPLEAVRIPVDKNGRRANYGFVVVKHEKSVDYAVQLLNGTILFDRNIMVKLRNCNARMQMQSPPFQPSFHNERQYGKPYYLHDNRGRQNWNNHHYRGNHNERNRRWNH